MGLLLTKAKCWEYEQEWRVLHQEADKLYGYDRSSLTGIYSRKDARRTKC